MEQKNQLLKDGIPLIKAGNDFSRKLQYENGGLFYYR